MSFGTNNTTKGAENTLGGISNLAVNQMYPQVTGQAQGLMGAGAGNVDTGVNFLNTLLQGNQANTTALLQPQIDQIRANNQATMNAMNTLMPRGAGRSSALFNQSFAPQGQIQGLYNTVRSGAAQALPQIGLAQQGLGSNLYGVGNQALGTGAGVNSSLANLGMQQQQMSNNLLGQIGSGLFGLASLPMGGGASFGGKALGSLFGL